MVSIVTQPVTQTQEQQVPASLYWHHDLIVTQAFKKIRMHTLNITQEVFFGVQEKLFITNNISLMDGIEEFPAVINRVNTISRNVSKRFIKQCDANGAWKMLVLMHLHQENLLLSNDANVFFNTMFQVENTIAAIDPFVDSSIHVNGFTMRHPKWTQRQHEAARNTINHYINNQTPPQEPMLVDLLHIQRNERFFNEFIYSLQNEKAEITDMQLATIACGRFGLQLENLSFVPLDIDNADMNFPINIFVPGVDENELRMELEIVTHEQRNIPIDLLSFRASHDDDEKVEVKDDEEKTDEGTFKIDTEESLKREVTEWNECQPNTLYTTHLWFRIAKFFSPRREKIDKDAMNEVVERVYNDHGQDALFGLIDLYAIDVDHFIVYVSKSWQQKWPDKAERRRNTKRTYSFSFEDLRLLITQHKPTIQKADVRGEDGIAVSFNVFYQRYNRYGIFRYQRADAILDTNDLEAKEDYIQQEAMKIKAEVEIEQKNTIPSNMQTFHDLCFRMIKFVLRVPRRPPNPVKMNELIDLLYEEHGTESIFIIDDWQAKYLKDFEVYESDAHVQTFISRNHSRGRVAWMEKHNWIRRLKDLRSGLEVSVDCSILDEESIPVEWNCQLFLRGRYCVCLHYKKKPQVVADSCVINMDTEFHAVTREVDDFEALDDRKANDYHYGLKLAFKTLKILMGIRSEPPNPAHLKTFVGTQYTQYGTKSMFSVIDWHADCLPNFIAYSSEELVIRFGDGMNQLERIQWSEHKPMRKLLRDIKYGKTVSMKVILLDSDDMQSHCQIECMKMGRYSINMFNEIKKHKPLTIQALRKEENVVTTNNGSNWEQKIIICLLFCLVVVMVMVVIELYIQ